MGSDIVQEAKKKVRNMLKYCTAKLRLGSYSLEKGKTRYMWGFNLLKMLK